MRPTPVRFRLVLVLFSLALIASSACDKKRLDSVSMVNRGVEAYNNGDPETAADYFLRAVQLHPENDLAYYHLGLVERYDRGHEQGARKAFEEAHRLNPDNPDTAFQLATISLAEGKLDTAQSLLERSLKQDPQNHQADFQLGRVLEAKGKVAEADAAYRRAIATYAIYAPPYSALGDLYLRFDHVDEAVTVLQEGVRLNNNDFELSTRLGLALMEAGRHEEAREAFAQALAIEPRRAIHLFNLATAFERLGKTDKAIDLFQRFIEGSEEGQAGEVRMAQAIIDRILLDRVARTRARRVELPEEDEPAGATEESE